MRHNAVVAIAAMLTCLCTWGQAPGSQIDSTFRPSHWGDQGNGTYINPVLNLDYSDPDAIRVGDKYYMIGSDFHFMGMQILESDDLVNWTIVGQIYDSIDAPGYDTFEHYGDGSWAPSIRYHDGKFYVFFCTPTEGLYMTCSEKPEGPWSKLLLVAKGTGRGWEDPCPFWDEDGQAYLGRSQVGAGPIFIHKMSPDGTKLLDEGVEVYRGPVSEGTKIHKWNGYYYMSIPEGGVGGGNQVILRSASIYGPWDKKVVLETGSTPINGPHQGAIVDTPDGKWYFMHFQQTPVLGRVVHLQPMRWQDGWPVIGIDIDRNGIGEPVFSWQMPSTTSGEPSVRKKPATDDSFDGPSLGLQWQFNHNPVPSGVSLTEKKGMLAIHALEGKSIRTARNTITQKLAGYVGEATVMMDVSRMADGQNCGLVAMGASPYTLGIRQEGKSKVIYAEGLVTKGWGQNVEITEETLGEPARFSGSRIWLRVRYSTHDSSFRFSYSLNGKKFQDFGSEFCTFFGNWKGARIGLYSFNTKGDNGVAYFDNFVYDFDEKN